MTFWAIRQLGGELRLVSRWDVPSRLSAHHILFCSSAVSLVGLEGGGGNVTRLGRFANYLRSILPHADVTLTEMTARAIGQLALAEGTYTAEYVEFEVKRALEWILGSENKKLAAVSSCYLGSVKPGTEAHRVVYSGYSQI